MTGADGGGASRVFDNIGSQLGWNILWGTGEQNWAEIVNTAMTNLKKWMRMSTTLVIDHKIRRYVEVKIAIMHLTNTLGKPVILGNLE